MNCQPPIIKSALKNFPAKFRITVSEVKGQPACPEKSKEKHNNFGVLISRKLVRRYIYERNSFRH